MKKIEKDAKEVVDLFLETGCYNMSKKEEIYLRELIVRLVIISNQELLEKLAKEIK